MKLDRLQLLAATDKAIAADREAFDKDTLKRKADKAKALADWLTEYGPRWIEFADRVQYLVTNGYPVTDDDIPRARNGWGRYATGQDSWLKPDEVREYVEPAHLVNLRNVLRASGDDYVTQSALKGLGAEPLRTVLRYL